MTRTGYKTDNAIIMAAGMATRFAPLSYEKPKALIEVKGEVLIERQIRQLIEAGVPQIIVAAGYKKELFGYLTDKYGVMLVENPDYRTRNNHSTLYHVRDYLKIHISAVQITIIQKILLRTGRMRHIMQLSMRKGRLMSGASIQMKRDTLTMCR